MKFSACLFSVFLFLPALVFADPKPPEGFTAIFNGKNLKGWHGNNPHTLAGAVKKAEKDSADVKEAATATLAEMAAKFGEHWSVENDELVNDGHGPYATTDKEYGDIDFHIEYKTVEKADSGIYLRGTPQVQIWDHTNEAAHKHGSDKGSGGLWNNKAAEGKFPLVLADKPFGEWNAFRIRQLGARTWVWLNDYPVVDGAIMENFWDRAAPLPRTGPIHLQTHGGEIRWRNLFVREIESDEANQLLRGDDGEAGFESIFNGADLTGWQGAKDNYEVVDGAIRCKKGKGGNLFTEEEYGDFAVRFEFLLPPGGNNGLAIRYPGKGNPAYQGMTELQGPGQHRGKIRETRRAPVSRQRLRYGGGSAGIPSASRRMELPGGHRGRVHH